ncbi:MAG: PorP/SprF family type IX secretion system membrane protein [Crocinitomicaceae bacterium]|nr:PorP/SprF family type IX secretion system membrane protein [Crocinitomicaceae bacterium]
MRAKLTLLICVLSASISFGQNTPRFSQFNFAQGVNNPAALAIDAEIMVDMVFRHQWFGLEGAPTTGAINAQYELYHDMAVGLNVSYDLIGVNHATQVSGQYAYRAYFENDNALIFGVSLGMDQRVNDLPSAQLIDADDPAFAQRYSKIHLNAGFGMYYYSPRFYIGASIPQLIQSIPKSNASGFSPPLWHYYMTTGFYIDAGENYRLNPNIQIKAAFNTPVQADLILRNTFMNMWSLNVGYRTENSLIGGIDFLVGGRFRMGYAINYDLGKLSKARGLSHELYAGIGLPYHNSRENFSKKKYLNRKKNHKRDFHKGYKHRRWYNR